MQLKAIVPSDRALLQLIGDRTVPTRSATNLISSRAIKRYPDVFGLVVLLNSLTMIHYPCVLRRGLRKGYAGDNAANNGLLIPSALSRSRAIKRYHDVFCLVMLLNSLMMINDPPVQDFAPVILWAGSVLSLDVFGIQALGL